MRSPRYAERLNRWRPPCKDAETCWEWRPVRPRRASCPRPSMHRRERRSFPFSPGTSPTWSRCSSRVRDLPGAEPGRRDRMARQERPGASGLLPDPARRRHAARHRRHPGRARVEWAAKGALVGPHALLANEPAVGPASTRNISRTGSIEDKNYLIPFYVAKRLLFYNKPMFKAAGVDYPPQELRRHPGLRQGDGRRGRPAFSP